MNTNQSTAREVLRHFTGVNPKNSDSVCGAKWNPTAEFHSTNMWTHVTCPNCLALK